MSAAGFGYCCAVLVGLVFLAAGVAKLREPDLTVRSFEALGVPAARRLGRVVPVAELAIAVLLVVVPTVGGFAALAMLAFFTTFLVTRLRAGVSAPCSCFGSASREPLSAANLVGNGALLLASLAATLAPAPTRPSAVDVALVIVALAVEVVAHGLVRRRADAATERPAPAVGEPR